MIIILLYIYNGLSIREIIFLKFGLYFLVSMKREWDNYMEEN